MFRPRLTAAGVLATVATPLVLAALASGQAPLTHSCSVTDRQFIYTAQLNVTGVGLWGNDYLHGDASAGDVIAQAHDAASRVRALSPQDPSLQETRRLLDAMFIEYSKAIDAEVRHREAGKFMFRAYGLANFAHDVLTRAQPALRSRGCDVAPLL